MTEKQHKVLQVLLVVAFVVFGIYRVVQTRIQNEKNLSLTLERFANDMNSECPIKVGNSDSLLIRKVSFIENKTVVYEYQTLDYKKESFDVQQLKDKLAKPIVEELESMQSLVKIRNKDVIFQYHFFDNSNDKLFTLEVLFNTPISYR